jgi:CelD/BcsL family acetyltransferase involved in cellulose biosynthesis/peptidoglycan/xylan/chitin deacetylase (PgdA/CDA1 family)
MKIEEIRSDAQFAALRAEWNALLAESPVASTFITWEWQWAWWQAYGTSGDLRILMAKDESGTLRGIAPLRKRILRRYGLEYAALVFTVDGSSDSDYLDFIVQRGWETEVLDAFWAHLQIDLKAGTLLSLNEIPEGSLTTSFLLAASAREGLIAVSSEIPCAIAVLPPTWEEYVSKLAPRFRTKVRSALRKLEGKGDVEMRFCERADELEHLLSSLFELHGRRWATEGKPGVFGWNRKQAFYRMLSPLLLETGSLAFSALEWRGRILACQYGFVNGDRYFQLQEGYDPDCEHWNLGIGLRAWTIRKFLQRGIRVYDFAGGTSRHKSDWGSETITSKRLTVAARTGLNLVYCRGPEWEQNARTLAKKLLPGTVIRILHKSHNGARPLQPDAGGSFPRAALAAFYYYSPLRWIGPAARKQFRLRVSNGRGMPFIGLERRHEPSVRILYFHRVNNEADPFFPSTPVAQFEREIRHVAKNYRVVSLGEAVRRLSAGGPSEPVVVLTFDDGYADNCTVAFPILQKYGLTATIFLTTGALDSQKALWFERLNLAIKKTSHQSLDLELDVPRRLYLRTDAERLRAVRAIYGFLRNVPEGARQERLTEILHLLEVSDLSDRDGRMLTWDQVRFMRSQGIDFGGHTVNHPFLSRLSQECAAWEVSECKRRIESELQEPVDFFAYPSGREMDFSESIKRAVEQAGYRAAVSTLWGSNNPATDRLELRRGQPWEDHGTVFAAKFDWYQWIDG